MTRHLRTHTVLVAAIALLAACSDRAEPVRPDPNPGPEVEAPKPTRITLSPSSSEMRVGETRKLTAEIHDQDNRPYTLPAGAVITWKSDAPEVAVVDSTGSITAVSAGDAMIRASYAGVEGTGTTRVKPEPEVVPSTDRWAPANFGDTLRVSATVDGASRLVSLSLTAETRILDEIAVLDTLALRTGLLRAVGPGDATIAVSAEGAKPAVVHISVKPVSPVVYSITGERVVADGSTLSLRGYLLTAIAPDAFTLPGFTVGVQNSTATDLTLLLKRSGTEPTACEGSARTTLSVRGAEVKADAVFSRSRAGEVKLAVGEGFMIPKAEANCLRLPAIADAEYALAYVDTRRIDVARTGQDSPPLEPLPIGRISLGDKSVPTAKFLTKTRTPAMAHPAEHLQLRTGVAGPTFATHPRNRGGKYELGEKVPLTLRDQSNAIVDMTGTVRRIYNGYYVVAFNDADSVAMGARLLAQLDSVFAAVETYGEPVFRRLAAKRPTSTVGAEQMLFFFHARNDRAVRGRTAGWQPMAGDPMTSLIDVSLNPPDVTAATFGPVLLHEIVHTWQYQRLAETALPGRSWGGFPRWAAEGAADFVAMEITRAIVGVQPFAGTDPTGIIRGPNDWTGTWKRYFGKMANAQGWLDFGYTDAASFYLDLLERRTAAGEPYEEAFLQIAHRAIEGWWGWDATGYQRTGLVRSMQPILGPNWSPEEAVLTWTLSYATNGQTGNPVFQVRSFKNLDTYTNAWKPEGVLRSGEGVQAASDPEKTAGSSGFFRVFDDGVGGTYALSADVPTRWMIVRVK